MADNSIIFRAVAPMLDARGFNAAGRIDALNAACSAYLASRDKAVIYNAVRPWMDKGAFSVAGRIPALDAACEQFLEAAVTGAGWWDSAPPASPPARPAGGHTIADFIGGFIGDHEGGLSMDPQDNGNWTGGHRGLGQLVGSKFGVTPGAVATYRGVAAASITKADIANLTKEEAVAIGVKNYYHGPGLDRLPWGNRVTPSVVDKGWGSGPGRAIKLLQRMLGLPEAGRVDQPTVDAYTAFLARVGEEAAARKWADVRIAFDSGLGQPRYTKGWNNRTRSFLPGTDWWRAWA